MNSANTFDHRPGQGLIQWLPTDFYALSAKKDTESGKVTLRVVTRSETSGQTSQRDPTPEELPYLEALYESFTAKSTAKEEEDRLALISAIETEMPNEIAETSQDIRREGGDLTDEQVHEIAIARIMKKLEEEYHAKSHDSGSGA